jgi:hypothetical protein
MTALLSAQPFVEPYRFVEIHVRLGEHDEAFVWLRKAFESRSPWFPGIAIDPPLEPLHGDPRFKAMLELASHTRYHAGAPADVAGR